MLDRSQSLKQDKRCVIFWVAKTEMKKVMKNNSKVTRFRGFSQAHREFNIILYVFNRQSAEVGML